MQVPGMFHITLWPYKFDSVAFNIHVVWIIKFIGVIFLMKSCRRTFASLLQNNRYLKQFLQWTPLSFQLGLWIKSGVQLGFTNVQFQSVRPVFENEGIMNKVIEHWNGIFLWLWLCKLNLQRLCAENVPNCSHWLMFCSVWQLETSSIKEHFFHYLAWGKRRSGCSAKL